MMSLEVFVAMQRAVMVANLAFLDDRANPERDPRPEWDNVWVTIGTGIVPPR